MAAKRKTAKKAIKKAVSKAKAKPQAKTKTKAKAKALKAKPNKKSKPAKAAKQTPVIRAQARPVISAAALEKLIQPLADRILVFIEKADEKTPGGLIIPGVASQKPNSGKVVALGSGRRGKRGQVRPLDVRVGDRVLFPEYVGTPVTIEGADLLILREEDVLGIMQ